MSTTSWKNKTSSEASKTRTTALGKITTEATSSSSRSKSLVVKKSRVIIHSDSWHRLLTLLWKCFIVRSVHWIGTVLEIFMPMLVIYLAIHFLEPLVQAQASSGSQNDTMPENIYNTSIYSLKRGCLQELQMNRFTKPVKVYYVKGGDKLESIISMLSDGQNTFAFDTPDDLYKMFRGVFKLLDTSSKDNHEFPFFAVKFDRFDLRSGQLHYSVRQYFRRKTLIDRIASPYEHKPAGNRFAPTNAKTYEYYQALVALIFEINLNFLTKLCEEHKCSQERSSMIEKLKIDVYRMPYPRFPKFYPQKQSSDLSIAGKAVDVYDTLAICILLIMTITATFIVSQVVAEKACSMKHLLSMLGLPDCIYWLAHFLNYFVVHFLQTLIIMWLLFGPPPIYVFSSPIVFFVSYLIYGAQLILFSLFLTTIFNRPLVAVIATIIIWLASSLAIFFLLTPSLTKEGQISSSLTPYLITSMFPTGSLLWLLSIMGEFENNFIGMHIHNLARHCRPYKTLSLWLVLQMMLLSLVVYVLLIWYFDNAWPWQASGVPKHPLFFLNCFSSASSKQHKTKIVKSGDSRKYEEEPTETKAMVQLLDLCKEYTTGCLCFKGRKTIAVKDVSLNAYDQQCTVLLGHNGAGKTTCLSMLAGLFPPTRGEILVDGRHICGPQGFSVRRLIGVCPQENIFYPELTVSQHLFVFGALRKPSQTNAETLTGVKSLLRHLRLASKANVRTSQLSGGMKRKTQLGMALIGDPKVLVLDEPSSGMDPATRRQIWNILLEVKKHRAIIITTHFMEEADALADRIVIMNAGLVVCSGSSMFLKRSFGAGYLLRVAKTKKFDANKFLDRIKKSAPQAELKSETSTEIIYSLGSRKSAKIKLGELAHEIESSKNDLGVESFGLNYTSLEDVFLKVGAENEEGLMSGISFEDCNILATSSSQRQRKRIKQQFLGLMLKRFHFARRYLPAFVYQLVAPLAIMVVAVMVDQLVRAKAGLYSGDGGPNVQLDIDSIYGGETQVSTRQEMPGPDEQKIAQAWNAIHGQLYKSKMSNFKDQSVVKWALEKAAASNLGFYSVAMLYGLELIFNRIQIWFNSEAIHSLVLGVINLFNCLVYIVLEASKFEKPPIHIVSEIRFFKTEADADDYEAHLSEVSSQVLIGMIVNLGLWFFVSLLMMPIAMTFLAASYVLYPIHEIKSQSKHLQLMTGLPLWLFYLSNFVFDMLVHCVAVAILTVVIAFLDYDQVVFGGEKYFTLCFLMMLFGISSITFSYLIAPVFSSPAKGFTTLVIVYLSISLLLVLGLSIYDVLEYLKENSTHVVVWMFWPILNAMPMFSFLFGFQRVVRWAAFRTICRQFMPKNDAAFVNYLRNMTKTREATRKGRLEGHKVLMHVFKACYEELCQDRCFGENVLWNLYYGPWKEIILSLMWSAVFFMCLLAYDPLGDNISAWAGALGKRFKSSRKEIAAKQARDLLKTFSALEDADVKDERQRILKAHKFTELLVVNQISKRYDTGFLAVDRLSFSVENDEVFGLLGVNGAGKSSLFSMLTGVLRPTSGDALLDCGAISLVKQKRRFQESLGYCPQFDAFLEKLNAFETLALFARLRGTPTVNKEVIDCLKMIGIEYETALRRVETYSGGNRRKLSIGMAIVGQPRLVLLDEPTSGVDPAARRKIWQALRAVRNQTHCSIVITSHSMDECEALCSRIAIMVSGHFRCLGSTQRLQTRYGQGFYIMIKIKPATLSLGEQHHDTPQYEKVVRSITDAFPGAKLKDARPTVLLYHLNDSSSTWSSIFNKMETIKTKHEIMEDYVVSGTTLEQIFLLFAQMQKHTE